MRYIFSTNHLEDVTHGNNEWKTQMEKEGKELDVICAASATRRIPGWTI